MGRRASAAIALAAVTAVGGFTRVATAATVFTYNFNSSGSGAANAQGQSQPAGATFSNFTLNGVTSGSSTSTFTASNWPTPNALDPNAYYSFSVSPTSGNVLFLTDIALDNSRSSGGSRSPGATSRLYGNLSSAPLSESTLASIPTSLTANPFNFTDVISGDTLTFRYHAYNVQNSGISVSVDNVATNGSVQADSAAIALANPTQVYADANALTLSNTISGATGANLTKLGSNTLTLTGANSFAGPLSIGAGTLRVNAINSTPGANQPLGTATSAISVGSASAGTFVYTGGTAATLNRGITVGGAGGATIRSTAGQLTLGTGGTTSGVSAGANALTFDASGGDISVTSVISGSGTVTKTGANTLALSGNNTFTGPLTITGGTVSVNAINSTPTANQPLGNSSAAITLGSSNSGAALEYTGNTAATLNRQVTIGGAGGGTIRSTAALLTLGTGGTTSGVSGGGNPVTFDANGGDISVAGVISGTGTTLTKIGGNNLTLSGANSYTGDTTISAGTLTVTGSIHSASTVGIAGGTLAGNGSVLGNANLSGGSIAMGSGGNIAGTLGVTGGNWNGQGSVTCPVIASSGTFTIGSSGNLTATSGLNVTGGAIAAAGGGSTITGSVNYTSPASSTFAGQIAGAGSTLTLNNPAATLTLTGTNTYTGDTNISAGTLAVNGTLNAAAGAVNVKPAGTLAGANGTIARTVNVEGTVSPGGSTAESQLTTGNQNWSGGSTYRWSINDATGAAGTGYDTLTAGGTLAVNATTASKILIKVTAGAVANFDKFGVYTWTIASATDVTGFSADKFVVNVDDFAEPTHSSHYWQVAQAGNSIQLTYVPEPASATVLGGGIAFGLLGRRRRRRERRAAR
jgi:autotransporter-associated beta strand protein